MSATYRIITDREEFGALRGDWNDLARNSAVDHAFMRHEWFCGWWDNMPHGGDLCVMTAWEGGRLVAAAPTMKRPESRRGVSFTALGLMVSGITPRCNFLVREGVAPETAFAGVFEIPGWDAAEFKQLEAEAPLTRAFVDHLDAHGGVVVEDGASSPFAILPASWEEFEKSRTKGYRKRFRNSLNRCRSVESFVVERIDTFAGFEACFEDMLTISRNSWKAEGGTDLVTQRGMAEFFRGFARDTEAEGLWVLYLLRLEGKPVAIGFAVRHDSRLVLLRWEFDDAYRYYMPGVVVHVHAIQDMIQTFGGGEYDLSGTASDFKSGLVSEARRHVDITFGSGSVRAKMLMLGKNVLEKVHIWNRRDGRDVVE